MTLQEKIYKIRNKSGLAAHIFAVKIGVTPSMVYHYENGKRKPGYNVLQKLISEFNVNPGWLFNSEITEQPVGQ